MQAVDNAADFSEVPLQTYADPGMLVRDSSETSQLETPAGSPVPLPPRRNFKIDQDDGHENSVRVSHSSMDPAITEIRLSSSSQQALRLPSIPSSLRQRPRQGGATRRGEATTGTEYSSEDDDEEEADGVEEDELVRVRVRVFLI